VYYLGVFPVEGEFGFGRPVDVVGVARAVALGGERGMGDRDVALA
jgi:hypothetical protein